MKSLSYDDLEDTLVSRRDPTIRQVSFSTTPYRSSDLVLKEKKTSGLLVKPKKKRHNCRKPFLFARWLFFWLPPIENGALFRCPKCLTIHEAKGSSDFIGSGYWLSLKKMEDGGLSKWKEMGGDEK